MSIRAGTVLKTISSKTRETKKFCLKEGGGTHVRVVR